MLEAAKLPEVREAVQIIFKEITQPIELRNKESFVMLGWICTAYLDAIEVRATNEEGLALIESIMHISLIIYIFEGKRKVTIASEIDGHRMWKNQEMWNFTLKRAIENKIKDRQLQ
jgi:hypothetical protein